MTNEQEIQDTKDVNKVKNNIIDTEAVIEVVGIKQVNGSVEIKGVVRS